MLERLRGRSDPVVLLASVPGVGRRTADRLLTISASTASRSWKRRQTTAACRPALAGFGEKRLAGVRDSLAQRLGRVRRSVDAAEADEPSVAEPLDVDREYREKARAGTAPDRPEALQPHP